MQERRKYVRSDGLVLIDYKEKQISGKSSAFDVSGAGVRITVDQQLKIGSAVDLHIYLPGCSQPIQASGKVIWVEQCIPDSKVKQQKQYFYTGIAFTKLDEDSKKKIIQHVFQRLHQE